MTAKFQQAKTALRLEVRARLKAASPWSDPHRSSAIRDRIKGSTLWSSAGSILFFAPLPEEPDIWPLAREALVEGKRVALPRFESSRQVYVACELRDAATDLVQGRFNIREPGPACVETGLNRLDLVLVPGVAFDPHRRRLGRGKGFYDQLLALVRGATCGVAYDEQIVPEIPVEPHDIRLNCILTPTRWFEP